MIFTLCRGDNFLIKMEMPEGGANRGLTEGYLSVYHLDEHFGYITSVNNIPMRYIFSALYYYLSSGGDQQRSLSVFSNSQPSDSEEPAVVGSSTFETMGKCLLDRKSVV